MRKQNAQSALLVSLAMVSLCHVSVFAESKNHDADQSSLKAGSNVYIDAFANADVNKLLSMWEDYAVYTDQFGNVYRNKAELKAQYEQFFQKYGGQAMQINLETLAFPTDNTAIETGTSRLLKSNEPAASARYVAAHVKKNGKWLLESVSETPLKAASNGEYLKPLEWLLGTWKASNSEAGTSIDVNLSWANPNVISRQSTITKKDGSKVNQTEFIFWNPETECISSWQFDANGGTSHSWWEQAGDTWIIHASSVQADGSPSRADYYLSADGANSFSWQSKNRSLAGVSLPDTELIKVSKVKS